MKVKGEFEFKLKRGKDILDKVLTPRFRPVTFRMGRQQVKETMAKVSVACAEFDEIPHPLRAMIEQVPLLNWMEVEYSNGVCEVHSFDLAECCFKQ